MVQNTNTNLHIKVQLINHYKNTSFIEELKTRT